MSILEASKGKRDKNFNHVSSFDEVFAESSKKHFVEKVNNSRCKQTYHVYVMC